MSLSEKFRKEKLAELKGLEAIVLKIGEEGNEILFSIRVLISKLQADEELEQADEELEQADEELEQADEELEQVKPEPEPRILNEARVNTWLLGLRRRLELLQVEVQLSIADVELEQEGSGAVVVEAEGGQEAAPGVEVEECPIASDSSEAAPEAPTEELRACLEQLSKDFERGIVRIEEGVRRENFKAALKKDKAAGTSWKAVKKRLLANESALLKKAASMQGKGELIGIFTNDELCIVDRADEDGNREPVIIAIDTTRRQIMITMDTPNKWQLIKELDQSCRFANYHEMRAAALAGGFSLPNASIKKVGIIAAVETVTEKLFIKSQRAREPVSAILEWGDLPPEGSTMTVVEFYKGGNHIRFLQSAIPGHRLSHRGMVRVLRG